MQELSYNIDNIFVNYTNFETLKNFNPCIKNFIFIGCNGNIQVCQKMSNKAFVLGNVSDALYKSLMNDEMFSIWEKNNYEDPKCYKCSKKLMCVNCKASFISGGVNFGCISEE
ncbi:SPASM domain-containing protein [Hathewaya massiliensis]|uniref:SPASM domain-containing protein n=1 Tax=Hathewaya massiliensis TaxID=1964382 RepID=UPI00163D041A|nr:SPASM domain-containing protein [Hathewaya massiliensis]